MGKELTIERKWLKDTYTIGVLLVDNVRWCDTMEDRDRGLADYMPESKIKALKVYGETAIPKGSYIIELTRSEKFASREWGRRYNGLVPEIKNVRGFEGVRIHPLNTAEDSLGCIGPGENRVKGQVINSTKWYYKLMDEVFVPCYKSGEAVTLMIK